MSNRQWLRFSLCLICLTLMLVLSACQSTKVDSQSPTILNTPVGEQTSIKDIETTAQPVDEKPQSSQVEETPPIEIPSGPTIALDALKIGDRIQDPSWNWTHRAGDNHTNSSASYSDSLLPKEQIKPVVWIIVGIDHYDTDSDASHFVLLSEEFLFRYTYSDGKNSWKDSTAREFINTTFVDSFSSQFKAKVPLTAVPNWDTTYTNYNSQDYAWILSKDEYGAGHIASQPTGSVLSYFDLSNTEYGPRTEDELKQRRMTTLVGDVALATRFPSRSMYASNDDSISQMENLTGNMGSYAKIYGGASSYPYRIAICLNTQGIQVTQATDSKGVHSIIWE
jgi:hypothetical protein